ncbi:DUF6264 family protein [Microbacterium sp. NPDC006705]|uniref:DUF6264 family protein n=1 Tax=Microbacterium plantarum TaxID=1816425 RepID=A0ABV5ETM1_9MICO|nr:MULTISPECIES: DUF6264 family protein [Microbacterium]RAZ30280.1 hypothetical protein DO944_15460 [Microbacterium sp. SMR1]WHE34881.1 DUF6264 family protein [Microbacterium sp. BDGP8]WRK15984.1 DUF6264 family protein [Microbacterium plantarum]
MSEQERPRPQYGEYATPEEQRARIAALGGEAPHPDVVETAQVPAGSAAPRPHESARQQLPSPRPTTSAARPTRLADRIITVALLAYGLVTVLGAIPQLVDFTGFAQTWMDMAGIDGTLADPAGGRAWGIAAAVVYGAGWLLTAVLSWWSLSLRRLSWWIPLVGAIVTFIIVSLLLAVPLLSDPAVLDGFSTSR